MKLYKGKHRGKPKVEGVWIRGNFIPCKPEEREMVAAYYRD